MYNYAKFNAAAVIEPGDGGVLPGLAVPEAALRTIEGERVSLSSLRGKPVLLETGSLTCPIYSRHIPAMNQLAAEFPAVTFLVLYVREAHPGKYIPAHRSGQEKLDRARELATRLGERRTVIVDDLEGTAHQALGGLPDMLYLIDHGGAVVYRARWNDGQVARAVLTDFLQDRLVDGIRSHFRIGAPWRVVRELRRAGPDAAAHFLRAYPALLLRQWQARLSATHRS